MSAMVKKVCFCRSGKYLYRKRMGEQAFIDGVKCPHMGTCPHGDTFTALLVVLWIV